MSLPKQKLGKERFLQIAEKLFTERGYQAVSIRDIAAEVGVTNAAIYYHFSSKEDLFDEVIIQHIERFRRQMLDAADQHDNTKDRLIAMLAVYSSLASHKHSVFTLLHMRRGQEPGPEEKARAQELMMTFFEPVEETINSAIEAGELRELPSGISGGVVLIGMLHSSMQQMRQFQQREINPEIIAELVDIFWNGMINRSE